MDTQPETIEVQGTSERKPHPGRRMTEAEFVAWADEDTRAEWVNGEVIVMSPENLVHVSLVGFLYRVMHEFVEQRELGVVLMEGFATRITLGETIRRRVPDVLFVAQDRLHLLRKTHLEGPPDLIVEVVSDDSFTRDWREKYLEYEQAGVREYWVVDPLARRVEAYVLGEDRKYARTPESGQTIHSAVLDGFFLRPAWLFQEPRPKTRDVLQEIGIV